VSTRGTCADLYAPRMPGVGSLQQLQRAIDAVDIAALPLQAEPVALDAARKSLDDSGFLLLGEVHGVRENPLIMHTLLTTLGVSGIGLEWHEELTGVVSAFATGRPLSDHPLLWGGDGRITAGHLALLRSLASTGQPDPVLFDGTIDAQASWSHRDREMALRVLAANDARPRLLVAGNLHTRTRRTRAGTPMGSHLSRERPGVREIRIVYGGGRYYNLGACEFSGRGNPSPRRHVAGSAMSHDHLLFYERRGQLLLELPEATEAVVPHRPTLPHPPR
jgi:hypothetical protein